MVKKVKLPLDKALKKLDPQVEKEVNKAIRRSAYVGGIVGFLIGIVLTALIASYNVSPRLIQNAQSCDLFAFGPVRPDLPFTAPQVCWEYVSLSPYQDKNLTVFLCPTPRGIRMGSVLGDVNVDVVSQFYQSCKVMQQPPVELNTEANVEVNG